MKIFAPEYYNHFKCIADKCTHSCCVGWRIELDERTLDLYSSAVGEYAEALRKNIASDNDGKYIPLTKDGRCPHLDSCGLCNIIKEYGESYLSDICTEHPRFYNSLPDRLEVGLGASCPEAARLILDANESNRIVTIGEDDISAPPSNDLASDARELIFAELESSESYSDIESRLWRDKVGHTEIALDDLVHIFDELEYLNEEDRSLFSRLSSTEVNDDKAKRLLHYFIFRHLSVAEDESDVRTAVGFALLSVRAVYALAEIGALDIKEALMRYSEEIEYSTDNTDALLFEISDILFS